MMDAIDFFWEFQLGKWCRICCVKWVYINLVEAGSEERIRVDADISHTK